MQSNILSKRVLPDTLDNSSESSKSASAATIDTSLSTGCKHKAKAIAKKSNNIVKALNSDQKPVTCSGSISVMLAHNYDPEKHDPTGWLMSEKLDGVRCYWNGTTMYTRTGKLFYPSADFVKKLPKMALDGELWTDRDDF